MTKNWGRRGRKGKSMVLDLQLPILSAPITTNVVSSHVTFCDKTCQ